MRLTLSENPTTGYTWIIPEIKLGFNTIWDIASEDYQQRSNPEGLVGVGGTKIIVFNCKEEGNEVLTIIQGREWLLEDAIEEMNKSDQGYFDPRIM